MSQYVQEFHFSHALKGPNANTIIYKVSLTPPASSSGDKTFYQVHVASALEVELLDVEVSLSVHRQETTKAAPYGVVTIVADSNASTTVGQLAHGRPIADAGQSSSHRLSDSVGVRRVIKGVYDAGGAPAIFVALYCSWDASSLNLATLSGKIKCQFKGTDDALVFSQALPDLERK